MSKRVSKKVQKPNIAGMLLLLFSSGYLLAGGAMLLQRRMIDFIVCSGCLVLLASAAWLTRTGIAKEKEYRARSLAVSPKPYRKIALALVGCTSFLTSFLINDDALFTALVFSAVSGVGYYLYYGFDPSQEKINERIGGYSTAELVEIIAEAESKIARIKDDSAMFTNLAYKQKIESVLNEASSILRSLEKRPSALRKARRFLNVYLDGAIQIIGDYAKLSATGNATSLETPFEELLDKITTTFKLQHERLLADEVLDLDIQIEVLKKQMQIEN